MIARLALPVALSALAAVIAAAGWYGVKYTRAAALLAATQAEAAQCAFELAAFHSHTELGDEIDNLSDADLRQRALDSNWLRGPR